MKTLSIFGSTGSIGKNSIAVIKQNPDKFKVKTLVAKNDVDTLISQALDLHPEYVVIENKANYAQLKNALTPKINTQILSGFEAVIEVAKIKYDLMISAIVGAAGMIPTMQAIQAGTNIALANKESLICAGHFMLAEAQKNHVKIIPIDSEHNAIFQIFENNNIELIDEIILTASGGPFFHSSKDFSQITVNEALKHPKWQMGAKISIDSATMMNKGLEMIEAYYLFPLNKKQINILIHPQSIIHGIVNYADGSTIAMMSVPDMKVPISFALNYPTRSRLTHQKLDLANLNKLEFFAADYHKFPALKICQEALEQEGNSLVIVNASNEVAVNKFLTNQITFDKITQIVSACLNKIPFRQLNSIDEVIACDIEVRNIANQMT